LKGEKVKPRVEVQVRLDFLALSPVEDRPRSEAQSLTSGGGERHPESIVQHPSSLNSASRLPPPAAAYIPFRYIADARQRIEIYRKLAQATDQAGLRSLKQELRDRFGPLPPPLELLLRVAELKVLAGEQGITVIEVKEDKLMLTRNNDYLMVGSKFPRLTKKQAGARLKEINQLLAALLP
jgi:transcription-repair coupling factor (superfamily II helicase)